MFPLSCGINTSGRLEEREKLWKRDLTVNVSLENCSSKLLQVLQQPYGTRSSESRCYVKQNKKKGKQSLKITFYVKVVMEIAFQPVRARVVSFLFYQPFRAGVVSILFYQPIRARIISCLFYQPIRART